jgi:hypothetical protein
MKHRLSFGVSVDISDSFNLVEPLEPKLHVSPKYQEKCICGSEGVIITTWKRNKIFS